MGRPMSDYADYGRPYPARSDVRTVSCPACGARPGWLCVGARDRARISNHQERVGAYLASASAGRQA